jgi:hypothetical protein
MKDKLVALLKAHAGEVNQFRRSIAAIRTDQIQQAGLKTTAHAIASRWFNEVKPALESANAAADVIAAFSSPFEQLMQLSRTRSAKSTYLNLLDIIAPRYQQELVHAAEIGTFLAGPALSIAPYLAGLPTEEGTYLDEAQRCLSVNALKGCIVLGWCATIARIHEKIGKIGYAPYHFLDLAQHDLAARQSEHALEITFDPGSAAYLRPNTGLGLYGPQGEFYSIGVRNSGSKTLDDVTLRALPSWFTREAIAVAQGQSGSGPVDIIRRGALHPKAEEIAECFGLDYHQPSSAPEYIFNTVQRFTLEATARDAASVRREFEYDPAARPMLKMVSPA